MQASWKAGALAIGLSLGAEAPAAAQTAHVSAPPPVSFELRAQGEALESGGDLLGAAAGFEAALDGAPRDGHLHWRIARDLLRHAERNASLDDDEREGLYERARDWAHAGREVAPDCAECCLYEFASTARLATVRGVARAVGAVREAGQLLEQCLANPPSWVDATGSEEAALYYGASVYYRMLPDSAWLSWATGERSDAGRATELARRALAIERGRARYQLELAAALLCDGARRDDAAALAEGRRWLENTAHGEGVDADLARQLQGADPREGCRLDHDVAAPQAVAQSR
jgi:tetratricopeptide (TPR) repeat protein